MITDYLLNLTGLSNTYFADAPNADAPTVSTTHLWRDQ
jgi:hypothetical protein